MDNVEAPVVENSDTQVSAEVSTGSMESAAPVSMKELAGWKSSLSTDLKSSPLLQKFEDTPDGLNKAMESHANLEKLLGHEKVPIPKDVNDVEGWNRFSKAMGIPDKAQGYGLPDAPLPESMKDMAIDKNRFAEVVHAHKLTPSQAKGLWKVYNEINMETYNNAMKQHQEGLNKTVNSLKGEWGDAYQTNVELGQMVINKFSDAQETNDYITNVLSQDPRGIKFLAKIGEQFAENKVGEFQMKRFSMAPEEAQGEVDKLTRDLEGPYMNTKGKFTTREHEAAVDRVNALIQSIQRAKG